MDIDWYSRVSPPIVLALKVYSHENLEVFVQNAILLYWFVNYIWNTLHVPWKSQRLILRIKQDKANVYIIFIFRLKTEIQNVNKSHNATRTNDFDTAYSSL